MSSAAATAWWRDVRVLRGAFQAAVVVVVAGTIAYLAANLVANLRTLGLPTDYGFLDRPAGFRIAGSGFRSSQPVLDALLVGLKNTVLVSAAGIVLATLLGLVVGVARLSTNWLVARLAAVYVESLRNIPVLVIIIFWSAAVLLKLPPIGRAVVWLDAVVLSNRGLWVPWLRAGANSSPFWLVVAVAILVAAAVGVRRTRIFEATGKPHHRVLWVTAVFALVLAGGYAILGSPVVVSIPELADRRVTGGFAMSPEYAAVLFGLVVYTASHIAEIVRGAILAVPRGQTEAAAAVGLSALQRLRLVVLPQAFRVAIPPVANQYLNLTKNSSLGIAVAYAELTTVSFVVIGNANPAPQVISVMMAAYLTVSIAISLLTNAANRRLRLAR